LMPLVQHRLSTDPSIGPAKQALLSRMRNHLAGSLKPAGFKLRGLIPHLFLRLFQLPDHHEYTFVTRNHVAQPVKPTLISG
jgi:hypothetical protein